MSEVEEEFDYLREFQSEVQSYVIDRKDDEAISTAAKKAEYLANQVVIEMYPDPSEVPFEIFEKYRYLLFQKLLKDIEFSRPPVWEDEDD